MIFFLKQNKLFRKTYIQHIYFATKVIIYCKKGVQPVTFWLLKTTHPIELLDSSKLPDMFKEKLSRQLSSESVHFSYVWFKNFIPEPEKLSIHTSRRSAIFRESCVPFLKLDTYRYCISYTHFKVQLSEFH